MRRAVESFMRGLPLDPRARRVVDETLLDWAREAADATTAPARLGVELRSLLSIARALAFATVRDIPRVPIGWLSGRLGLFGVLPVAIIVVLAPGLAPIQALRIAAMLLTGWLPFAFFYAIAWRPASRSLPILAVAAFGGALIATFVLYISPHVMWRLFEEQFREANRLYPAAVRARQAELFDEWGARLTLVPRWWLMAEALGPVALTAALVVFAEAVRHLSRWRRVVIALAPCLYAVAISGVASALSYQRLNFMLLTRALMLMFFGLVSAPEPGPFAVFGAATQLLLALALVWASTRLTRRRPEPSGTL